jgi:hypothetical protein
MQTDDMANDTVVTLRMPQALKRRLERRARANHRSLSAQALHDLAEAVETAPSAPEPGRFLGLFPSATLPSDADIRVVRQRLWGRLRAGGRRG